jgi:hypothetical protein
MTLSIMSLGIDIEGHYAQCRCAEYRYAECHYAECCYAECHYGKCRGASGLAPDMDKQFGPFVSDGEKGFHNICAPCGAELLRQVPSTSNIRLGKGSTTNVKIC